MKNYFKYKLFLVLINPFFYASAIIFNLLSALYFFIIKGFFTGISGTSLYNLFNIIPLLSVFLIPLLLVNSKKTKMEESIPLSFLEKVITDFLALALQILIIFLPLLLIPACVNLFGQVDWGILFCAFLNSYLFAISAASLCLFICEASENQTLALLLNILILALLYAGNIFINHINQNSPLIFLLKSLCLSYHSSASQMGIFDSRDFLYFIIFSCIFILLTLLISLKKAGKKFTKSEKRIIFYICVIIIFSSLNARCYYLRKDISLTGRLAISQYTQDLLSQAEDKILITYYKSKLLQNFYPEERAVLEFYRELSRHKNVIFKVSNADDLEIQKNLEEYGIYGRDFRLNKENGMEYTRVYSAIVFEYAGNYEVLPFVLSSSSLEFESDIKLAKLIMQKEIQVNILLANSMNLDIDYSYLIPWLNREGFKTSVLDPNNIDYELSSKIPLILIGHENLSPLYVEKISAFLDKGGLLFACVSPYNADIENSWSIQKSTNTNFISLLSNYGFEFTDSITADISSSRIIMQSENDEKGNNNSISKVFNYTLWPYALPQEKAKQGITLFWPSGIASSSKDVSVACISSPAAWSVKEDKNNPLSLFTTNPFELNNMEIPKTKESIPLVLSSKNIVLVPDQYFVHSLMLGYLSESQKAFTNLDFVSTSLFQLIGENDLATLLEKSYSLANKGFFKTYDSELFTSAKNRSQICLFIILPLSIIILALLFFKIRRGKENE